MTTPINPEPPPSRSMTQLPIRAMCYWPWRVTMAGEYMTLGRALRERIEAWHLPEGPKLISFIGPGETILAVLLRDCDDYCVGHLFFPNGKCYRHVSGERMAKKRIVWQPPAVQGGDDVG
jgi:hypothetical protein